MLRRTLFDRTYFRPFLEQYEVRGVIGRRLPNKRGFIFQSRGERYIVISLLKNRSWAQRNFAVAHELAHIDAENRAFEDYAPLETWCQRRAGEILVHLDILEFALEEYSRDPRVIQQSCFPHASLEVVTKRIADYTGRRAYFHYQPMRKYFIFDPQEYIQQRLDRPVTEHERWEMYRVNSKYLVGLEVSDHLPAV